MEGRDAGDNAGAAFASGKATFPWKVLFGGNGLEPAAPTVWRNLFHCNDLANPLSRTQVITVEPLLIRVRENEQSEWIDVNGKRAPSRIPRGVRLCHSERSEESLP